MTTVTIREAEDQLEDLIARAEAGEEILIARGGDPVAKLTALPRGGRSAAKRRVFGSLKGKYGTDDGPLLPPGSILLDTSFLKVKS